MTQRLISKRAQNDVAKEKPDRQCENNVECLRLKGNAHADL